MARRTDDDFRAEIEAHIAHEIERLVSEGMAPEEARAEASKAFGSVTIARERFHESSRWQWREQIVQDTRYAARSWRKRPALAAVIVLSLAIGIGANTAIFSAVHTLLLKDLPYKQADRLMYVSEYWPREPVVPGPPSPDFANWRRNSKLAEGIAAYGGGAALNLTAAGDPERVQGTMVTHNLLPMIGAGLSLGRNFTAEEDRLGASPVAILGYGLWQRRFAGSKSALGKAVTLNGVARTIVGVLPAGFRFPDNNFQEELLVPMALPPNPNWRDERNFRLLRVIVRAKPGVSSSAMRDEFAALLKATAAEEPPMMVTMRRDMEVRVTPLRDWLTGGVRTMTLALQGAVAMLLLIACLNIASLQVGIALSRRKEIALRAAVGASAPRIVRQLFTETLLLTTVAGCVGVALAYASLDALRSFLPSSLRLADLIVLDRRVLLFALLITAAAAILTGLIPAVAAARGAMSDAFQENSDRASGARGQRRLHGILVIAEVTAAMVLLAGAGQLIRAFLRLAAEDPGFNAEGVLTMKIAPSPRRYPKAPNRVDFYQQLLERARAIPGVEHAAIGGGLPLDGTLFAAGISFQDRPEPPAGGRPSIPVAFVSPDYFHALGIPIVRGRAFSERDTANTPLVAIVNQAFAEEYFRNENPLGKRIEFGSRQQGRWHEIVGVAGNVKQQGRRVVDPFIVYGALPHAFESETYLILKSRAAPEQLASAARRAVRSLDSEEPVFNIASMEQRLSESLSAPRSSMTLMSLFAAVALLLATVGVFGLIAYFVSRNIREIGIRMALGATRGNVARMVLARGMSPVSAGIALGCAGAQALTRALRSRMPELGAADSSTLLIAGAVFLLAAAIACLIPARRAAQVDPAVTLRLG